MTKVFGPFSFYYRLWQTSRNTFKGPTSYFDNYCGTYSSNFLKPKRLLKTQNFEKKKGNLSSEKNIVASFFSFYRVTQTWMDIFEGSNKYSGNYCGNYKIIPVTPKRIVWKHKFSKKKVTFPVKKISDPVSSYYPVWQTSRNTFKGSTSYSDNYCGT